MSNFKRLMIGLLLTCASAAALAADQWSNVTVVTMIPATSQYAGPNGNLQVVFSAANPGINSCGSSHNTSGVVDISTPGGALVASVLQAAKVLGLTVTVGGVNNCNFVATYETIGYVEE